MIELETKVKKWGNSLAIVLPRDEARKANIRVGKRIRIMIPRGSVDLRKEFGSLKNLLKKPTQKIKDELRNEEFVIENRN